MNEKLLELLRRELTKTRFLLQQDAMHIANRLSVSDPLDGLCQDKLGELEEYEVEILISPLFTPNLEQREVFENVLNDSGTDAEELKQIMSILVAENTACPVECGDSTRPLIVPEVVISRYLRLLHIDSPIPGKIADTLRKLTEPEAHRRFRPRAFSLARMPTWAGSKRRELLEDYLSLLDKRRSFNIHKLCFLTEHVRNLRPVKESKLIRSLSELVESYEMNDSQPVFNEQLEGFQTHAIPSQYCGIKVRNYRVTMALAILEDYQGQSS
ncbi:MAG: hypothetical protein G8345_12965 [Magnetococcales bacterium]|nr:hypothetical protein [Magnetococcales bacterium]NGZ27783.1 hypothetical protein [Magnetococcales bacterium]